MTTDRTYSPLPAILLLAAFVTPLPAAHADHHPAGFTAVYSINRGELTIGERNLSLARQADGRFVYESRTRTTGLLSLFKDDRLMERSRYRLADQSIQPEHYIYRHSGSDKNRNVDLRFDWEQHRVTNVIGGDAWQMAIPANTQDKLGYMIALMRDLHHQRESLEYPVADGGKLKTYRFRVVGKESLDTPLGKLRTVKLLRLRDNPEKRRTYLWCAEQYDYLPVRIEHHKKDTIYTMSITELHREGS
jgi:hypothetical protein